jgi:hypothetical protein
MDFEQAQAQTLQAKQKIAELEIIDKAAKDELAARRAEFMAYEQAAIDGNAVRADALEVYRADHPRRDRRRA